MITAPKPLIDVPWITTEEMIEVDRAMMEDYRIVLMQMMENAGRCLAQTARRHFLGGDPRGKAVVVMAGRGGNGGGALVCARRLHCWGAQVSVVLARDPKDFKEVPAHQLDVLQRMGLNLIGAADLPAQPTPALIIDGVIGYSLAGAPRADAASLIRWANAQTAPTLALDAPSGVDTTTGQAFEPTINAAATMTLALPKVGLKAPAVLPHIGDLYLADISVPPALYSSQALKYDVGPVFAQSDVVRIW